MTCWFFMSYVRSDDLHRNEELIRCFYDALKAAVSIRVMDQSPPIAYFDREDLKPGDPWPEKITTALRASRTFVPIMTARYFTREYCGKEWMIFEERCKDHANGGVVPPLIIPVLWVPPEEGELPQLATNLQVTFDPEKVLQSERHLFADYESNGLLYIAKRKDTTHHNMYETIVEQLASRIIRVAQQHKLPQLPALLLSSLKDAKDRFAVADQPLAVPAASSQVNFAFVAGRQPEMSQLRDHSYHYYGVLNSQEWIPFAPDEDEPIALIAQSVATDRKLICQWVTVDFNLIDELKRLEDDNSIAIIIVDPWTAGHPHYRSILENFDRFQFSNCVVLVAWNKADLQTLAQYNKLSDSLRNALLRNFQGRKEIYFRPKIEDQATLRIEIARALSDLEALLSQHRKPVRIIEESMHISLPSMNASGVP